jgi:putative ABC transport system permease protein
VLQVPIYALLAFYIYMVSRQILSLEQGEISVLKSRGASSGRVFSVYLMQSLLVGAASVVAGIPFGVGICKFIGSSNGFLDLVSRAALPVRLNADAVLYSLAAAAACRALPRLCPILSNTAPASAVASTP